MRLLGIARSRARKSNSRLLRNKIDRRVVGSKNKYRWVKKSRLSLNCCVQDAKSVGSLSGAGVMAGKMPPLACASTRYPFGSMQYSVTETGGSIELTKTQRKHGKNLVILRNAQKPHAARAAYAQALYYGGLKISTQTQTRPTLESKAMNGPMWNPNNIENKDHWFHLVQMTSQHPEV